MPTKPYYALTMNGRGMAIVESLEMAAQHIAGCAVDYVNGEFVEGNYVGTLLAIDTFGNRWSVKRVDKKSATMIEMNRRRRHEKRIAAFKASK